MKFRCGFVLFLPIIFCAFLMLSCPLIPPEKVRIVASPELYLPLGSPDALGDFDFDLSALASVGTGDIGGGGGEDEPEMVISDYPGGYPDTKAFVIKVKLIDWPLSEMLDSVKTQIRETAGSLFSGDELEAYVGRQKINIADKMESPTQDSTDQRLSIASITEPLKDYSLQFSTCNAYLYVDGPPTLFAKSATDAGIELSFTIKALDDADNELPKKYEMDERNKRLPRMACPDWPNGEPLTKVLDPKPTPMPLADVLNQPGDNRRPVALSIDSSLTIPSKEITIAEIEAHPALSVYMVLELPLEFDITDDFAIPVDPDAEDEEARTKIVIAEDDLFGRTGNSGGGDIEDIINRLEYITIEAKAKNNLGLSGHLELNTSSSTPPLGTVKFEGASVIRINKETIIPDPPVPEDFKFDLWARVMLLKGGKIKIKRQADTGGEPPARPLEIALGVSIKLKLDEAF